MLKTGELAPDHFTSACSGGPSCPLGPVHRRLQEAHRHWHQAADHYSDPEAFTAYLNSTVQSLRNLTFILQAQKADIPDFDSWYAAWQERYRSDPILKWLHDARTQVVHQSDLQTASTVRCKVVTWYNEPPVFETDLDPLTPTGAIAALIASKGDFSEETRKEGAVLVERRWVERDLPGHEVLTALAHCYGVLAATIDHFHLPPETRPSASRVVPAHVPCMVATEFDRAVMISLLDGEEILVKEEKAAPSGGLPPGLLEERYRFSELGDPGGAKPSLREKALSIFEMAKRIIEVDGFHQPIVLYFTADGKCAVMSSEVEDRAAMYVLWRVVAANVRKMQAVEVISVGEGWMAPVPEDGIVRTPAREDPARREVLQVDAVAQNGEHHSFIAEMKRDGTRLRLGPPMEMEVDHAFFLEPVRAVWREGVQPKDR